MILSGRVRLPSPRKPPEVHMDFPLRVTGVELELADEVMGAVPGPDLLRPRSNEDVCVGSGIQFPSSAGCNHLFGVHYTYGIRNTWLSLFSMGLSSFETATLKIFCAASHVGPVTPRLSRG